MKYITGNNEKLDSLKPYEQIIEWLRSLIITRQIKVGEKIPSERDIAEQFNVSRVPVREAIKIMEYMGVLESVHGDGIYLKDFNFSAVASSLSFSVTATTKSIFELLEVRTALETSAAHYAALRRTEEDIELLKKAQSDMRAALRSVGQISDQVPHLRHLSHSFHKGVFLASKNDVLINIYHSLFELLDISRQLTIGESGISYDSVLSHDAILHSIIEMDFDGARQRMGEHMETVRQRLFEMINSDDAKNVL